MKNKFFQRALVAMWLVLFCSAASAIDFAKTLAEAEQGDTGAMHNVGAMYASGGNVKLDYAQAMDWFQRAALRGRYESMYSLGIMYRFGQGVDVDMVQASAWYTLAAETIPKNGDEWILPRAKVAMYLRTADEMSKGLTEAQRIEAQSRADKLRQQIVPKAQ
jgi:TPR repeat protein